MENQRQKITSIKITKHRTTYEKDALGNRKRVKVPYQAKRKVTVVAGGKRFAHYFVDMLISYVLITAIYYLLEDVLSITNSGFMTSLILTTPPFVAYPLYYFLFELYFQTTPGKMLTGSLVINEYGEKPELRALVLRSIVRIVPFEAFSCLGERGWHDRWSHTWVVSKQELEKIQKHMAKNQAGH